MKRITPIRNQTAIPPASTGVSAVLRFWGSVGLASTLLASLAIVSAQAQTYQQHPPRSQMPVQQQRPPVQPYAQAPMQKGHQHLGQWLSSHQNETPEQQQRSLAREPGFNTLTPDQQQRMQQRLMQLNAMPPAQRQRTLAHMEAMERLTPDQRQQVRGALAGLGSLPPDQRRAVAHSFHQLRMLPPDQRQQMLNSPRFRDQLTDQERDTLNSLMAVEPYLPPPSAPVAAPGH